MNNLREIQLIASDLDGTLLNTDKRVPNFSAEVLAKLGAMGKHLVFATGRHYADAKKIALTSGNKVHFICVNGAQVYTNEGRLLAERYLAPSVVKKIVDIAKIHADININIYTHDTWYTSFVTEWVKKNAHLIHVDYKLMDIEKPPLDKVLKIYFTSNSNSHDLVHELETALKDSFLSQLNICFSSPGCLEVMDFGISKLSGLQMLCDHLNVDIKQTMAFGDGMNDIEILQGAGKGILVNTAAARVKALLPDAELIGSVENEAVANYLNQAFFV